MYRYRCGRSRMKTFNHISETLRWQMSNNFDNQRKYASFIMSTTTYSNVLTVKNFSENTMHDFRRRGSQFLAKYLMILLILVYLFCGFNPKFYFSTSDYKKKILKTYFPTKLKDNLTQIMPTNTNRASIEHKLILSYQLIRNVFSHFAAYILTLVDMNNCFVGDRDIIFQI
jgi:hypothetical protein